MNLNGYNFNGPYDFANDNFNEIAGIYVIISQNKLIYVGITNNLKERMSGHHKENCWRRNILTTNCLYWLGENNEKLRSQIEIDIINKYNPVCNEI